MKLLIVTGMSGAGKSQALKLLEDVGYEAIDNIPLEFLPALVMRPHGSLGAIAVGADVRGHDFSAEVLLRHIDRLRRRKDLSITLLFMDADDEVLHRRFSETRRKHPLAADRPVSDGIAREREILASVKEHADILLDTSDFTLPDLRREVTGRFSLPRQDLAVSVVSFSYKRGLPREADVVLDVRFLNNPHYVEALRPHTGKDHDVAEYIEADPDFAAFFERTRQWLDLVVPRYRQEGKSYLTIAFGCTGGRHRSVYVSEKVTSVLRGMGYNVTVRHRELES